MARSSASVPRKDPKSETWFLVVDVGMHADLKRR